MLIMGKRYFRITCSTIGLAVCLFSMNACGNAADDVPALQEQTTTRPPWLLRGGDVHRASTMSEWSSLDEEGRLASAADLVSSKRRRQDLPMPDLKEFERLARALEAKLTAVNADGSRDADYVGGIVDEIWASIE